jgi:hypothetical protein
MKYEEYMPECYNTTGRRDLEIPEKKTIAAFPEKDAHVLSVNA